MIAFGYGRDNRHNNSFTCCRANVLFGGNLTQADANVQFSSVQNL